MVQDKKLQPSYKILKEKKSLEHESSLFLKCQKSLLNYSFKDVFLSDFDFNKKDDATAIKVGREIEMQMTGADRKWAKSPGIGPTFGMEEKVKY